MSPFPPPTRRVIVAAAGLGLVLGALPIAAGASAPFLPAAPATDKVADTVHDSLESEGSTDVWIVLDARPDLSAAEGMSWQDRGRFVYDSLTSTAEEAQADLLADLDAAGADYEAFWINNAVFVRDADEALVLDAADSGAVRAVVSDFEVEQIEPVQTRAVPEPLAPTWGLEAIGAPTIWEEYDQRGEGIVVSALDSGVDATHPALVEKYRGTETGSNDYNWFDSRGQSDVPVDDDPNAGGHGTHVTGTIVGGEGENEIGVAPEAQFIGTAGCCVEGADVVETMQWYLAPTPIGGGEGDPDMRPHIINNSWGFSFLGLIAVKLESDDPQFVPIGAGMQAWTDAGIFHTWASGNFDEFGQCDSLSSPAWNDVAAYTVANFQEDGTIAVTSSRGPGEDGAQGPDIGAPGTNVLSTLPGGEYAEYSGTSMASPHVAGAVALLWAEFPDLQGDIEATRALLDETAVDTPDPTCGGEPANNNTFGEGTLDLVALFEAAGGDDPEPPATEIERWGGTDRYDTAELISAAYPDGVATVYVATGQDYADALAGAPGAAQDIVHGLGTLETPSGEAAPILLTKADSLPDDTVAALEAADPENVVILGGETRITPAVETELAAYGTITRIDGEDRYETAANLAAEWVTADVVIVASGEPDAYPDALTGGAMAAWNDAPVLLTQKDNVPALTDQALQLLDPSTVIVLGGTDAVSDATYAELGGTERIGGEDRYETGTLVSAGLEPGVDVVYVAFGGDYPDALAGSALAGAQDAAVLLTRGDKLSTATATELTRLEPASVVVLGGEEAIDATTYGQIEDLFSTD